MISLRLRSGLNVTWRSVSLMTAMRASNSFCGQAAVLLAVGILLLVVAAVPGACEAADDAPGTADAACVDNGMVASGEL